MGWAGGCVGVGDMGKEYSQPRPLPTSRLHGRVQNTCTSLCLLTIVMSIIVGE